MTNEPLETPDENSKAGIRKSLALAAAHGIGPFRKRVRLEDPLPYESDETYTSFTIDVYPPAPVWNYKGKLTDKPVELKQTHYPRSFPRYDSEKNIGILTYLKHNTLETFNTISEDRKPYTNGFTFNRNGMCYTIEFFEPNSYHTPSAVFKISPHDDDNSFSQYLNERGMTKQEAEYALEVIRAELNPFDQTRLALHLKRLNANLPTATEPEKTLFEEMGTMTYGKHPESLNDIAFTKGFGTSLKQPAIPRTFFAKDLGQLSQALQNYLTRPLNP